MSASCLSSEPPELCSAGDGTTGHYSSELHAQEYLKQERLSAASTPRTGIIVNVNNNFSGIKVKISEYLQSQK